MIFKQFSVLNANKVTLCLKFVLKSNLIFLLFFEKLFEIALILDFPEPDVHPECNWVANSITLEL